MASRRGFLAAAVALPLAGCMGRTLEREEDVAARKTRIAELELTASDRADEIERLNETAAARRERISELEAELADTGDALNESEAAAAELRDERAGLVGDMYEIGVTAWQFGNGAWLNGVEDHGAGNYASAMDFFGRAYSNYGRAVGAFIAAGEARAEHGLDAGNAIKSARQAAEAMAEASFQMENAEYYYTIGEFETADSYLEDANRELRRAGRYDVAPVEDVRARLGP